MTLEELKTSLASAEPPAGLSPALRALWHDARGDWDAAHRVAQEVPGEDGAWVHAYLHRKEGDSGNASYWYGQARQPVAVDSLGEEWDRIAAALLPSQP